MKRLCCPCSFRLSAAAYLSLLLFPLLEPLYRILGMGGGGEALSPQEGAAMLWMCLGLVAGVLALIAIMRKRCNVWHILALLGALPPLWALLKAFFALALRCPSLI